MMFEQIHIGVARIFQWGGGGGSLEGREGREIFYFIVYQNGIFLHQCNRTVGVG